MTAWFVNYIIAKHFGAIDFGPNLYPRGAAVSGEKCGGAKNGGTKLAFILPPRPLPPRCDALRRIFAPGAQSTGRRCRSPTGDRKPQRPDEDAVRQA